MLEFNPINPLAARKTWELNQRELNAVVLGVAFGKQVQAMFEKDLAASDAITLEQWERRPLHFRMKESLARVWEYWL